MSQHSFFVVSIAGDDKIAVLRLAPDAGNLELVHKIAVRGMPGPACFDAERGLLHVGLRSARQVASFHVAPSSGLPELAAVAPLPAEPCFLGLDRTRRYLFGAYYRAGGVSVNALHDDGRVRATTQFVRTAANAHCILAEPRNRFVYAAHVGHSNCIARLRFDPAAGRLRRAWWSRYQPPLPVGPRHGRFHPRLNLVYFANEQGSSISTYGYDTESGKLQMRDTRTTLHPAWSGTNLCAQIHLHPQATAAYVSNRGHDTLAVFELDRDSGLPVLKDCVPTESCPRDFSLSGDGRFLVVAGQKSGRVALFRVGSDGLQLEPCGAIEIGANLLCIEPLEALDPHLPHLPHLPQR